MLICLDLDGTLITPSLSNQGFHYHDWSILAGRRERLAALIAEGHTIGIVTNQSGVAFELITEDDFTRKIGVVLGALRLPRDTPVVVCFAHPKAKQAAYRTPDQLARRKPAGKMILELMERCPDATRAGVIYVGDTKEDQESALDAGVSFKWAWDFFEEGEQQEAPRWQTMSTGLAQFDSEHLMIAINKGTASEYIIDLKLCTDAARLLDVIFSIANKPWCTPRLLFDLLLCFEEASKTVHHASIQTVFCPFGQLREVQWAEEQET